MGVKFIAAFKVNVEMDKVIVGLKIRDIRNLSLGVSQSYLIHLRTSFWSSILAEPCWGGGGG